MCAYIYTYMCHASSVEMRYVMRVLKMNIIQYIIHIQTVRRDRGGGVAEFVSRMG